MNPWVARPAELCSGGQAVLRTLPCSAQAGSVCAKLSGLIRKPRKAPLMVYWHSVSDCVWGFCFYLALLVIPDACLFCCWQGMCHGSLHSLLTFSGQGWGGFGRKAGNNKFCPMENCVTLTPTFSQVRCFSCWKRSWLCNAEAVFARSARKRSPLPEQWQCPWELVAWIPCVLNFPLWQRLPAGQQFLCCVVAKDTTWVTGEGGQWDGKLNGGTWSM